MNGNTGGSDSRGRSPVGRLGARTSGVAAVALLAVVALLATACGGGGSGASGSGGSRYRQALAFSECMRAHGEPNFPDPGGNGAITIQGGGAAKAEHSIGGPQMTRAQRACAHLLPNGGVPTAAQRKQLQKQGLKFAECMRAHGVSNWPDPGAGPGGGGPIKLNINPHSPQVQSAIRACQKIVGNGGLRIQT